jgi:hypothetical protein
MSQLLMPKSLRNLVDQCLTWAYSLLNFLLFGIFAFLELRGDHNHYWLTFFVGATAFYPPFRVNFYVKAAVGMLQVASS